MGVTFFPLERHVNRTLISADGGVLNNSQTGANDTALALAARDDQDAFDTLYRCYVTRIYRYCYSRVDNRADAEDLTAQTFLAAMEGLNRYRGRGTFTAWLFGIARHKCADHHRQRYADPGESLDVADELADPLMPDPETNAYHNSIIDCVQRALSVLSPDRREALRLRFWGGLSAREIAAVMRRSEGAVKMLISRGVADLRRRCLDDTRNE